MDEPDSPTSPAASTRRTLLTGGLLAAFDDRAEDLAHLSARLFASEEAREGITAFLEKRPPSWAT